MSHDPAPSRLSGQEFRELAGRVASAWSRQDADSALACFAEDAVYMEPPDIQLYVGHAQLRPYFAALQAGTRMVWHNLWFDAETQIGVGEYSFGMEGQPNADHGVAVLELANGLIGYWREYQRKGPPTFEGFLTQEGKQWEWHIGNYP